MGWVIDGIRGIMLVLRQVMVQLHRKIKTTKTNIMTKKELKTRMEFIEKYSEFDKCY